MNTARTIKAYGKGKGRQTIRIVYNDINLEEKLYNALPDCEHEIVSYENRIECRKCRGYYEWNYGGSKNAGNSKG